MKRVITTLILILALVPLLLLMRWGGEAKAAWSLPVDGVRARLAAARFLWRPGDEIRVSVRVKISGGGRHVLSGSTPAVIVVRHDGREIGRFGPAVPVTGEVVVERWHQATLEVPGSVVLSDGPGLYEIAGKFGDFQLRPLKVRVVKAK